MREMSSEYNKYVNLYLEKDFQSPESEIYKKYITQKIELEGLSNNQIKYLKLYIKRISDGAYLSEDNKLQLMDLSNSINNNENKYGNIDTRVERPETIIVSISGEIIKNEFTGMHWQGLKSYPKTNKRSYRIRGISVDENDSYNSNTNRIDINSNSEKEIYLKLENGNREIISISYDKYTGIISISDRNGKNIGIAKLNEHYFRVNTDRMNLNISFH